ncbi:MAG: plasmid recombination protein [Bacillota bacterium]|nr:plasmid recombination protein [Bacillota bacterium]
MGYLSFDASIKIHKSGVYTSTKTRKTGFGGIVGYIRHIDRETDRRNNCEVNHSNPDIRPDFTLENESYYKDSNGVWQRTDTSNDMLDSVNRRIEYAKEHGARIASKGKNDTVIARPLVVQLDSDAIVQHNDTWVWDVMSIIEEMFGKENIIGFSIHKDETNVHVHIIFVPCYEKKKSNGEIKCTISQTAFFKNPRQLASMHKQIRKELKNKGYDIEQENKPIEEFLAYYVDKNGEIHQQGLTPDQLKELTNRKNQLTEKEKQIMLDREELDTLARAMADVQAKAQAAQENLENNLKIFECQQEDFQKEKANLQTQMKSLIEEKNAIKKVKAEADGMLEKAYSVSDICQHILAQEHTLNKDFLDFLDRLGQKNNKQYRSTVEKLYKMFDDERRTVISPWSEELDEIRRERNRQRTVDDIAMRFNTPVERDIPEYNFF